MVRFVALTGTLPHPPQVFGGFRVDRDERIWTSAADGEHA
jgi:hypothetical protein